MDIVTSVDFQRNLGHYADRALVEPVLVTRNGRERLVLVSADEYHRLKRLDRETVYASELTADHLAAIAGAEVPAEYAALDRELDQ